MGLDESGPVRGFGRATAIDLAEALGVHRNSVGRWRRQCTDCPPGPPYDEYAWRCWAAAKGIDTPRAPDQPLLDLLANTGIASYRRQVVPDPAAGIAIQSAVTTPQAPQTVAITFDEQKKQADARSAQALAEAREFELAIKRRQYIAVDEVHRLVDAVTGLVAEVCDQIAAPASAAVRLPPDQAELLRVAVLEQIHAGRRRVAASAEGLLAKVMESPA